MSSANDSNSTKPLRKEIYAPKIKNLIEEGMNFKTAKLKPGKKKKRGKK